jgi:ubiquitin-protein ligase
MYQQQ